MGAAARDQWAETIVGAAVLAAAAGFLIYALGHTGAGGARGGYELIARFGEAGALAAGADVRVAGVKVGTVSSIQLEPTFLARATLVVDPTVKLPADSTAKITSDGLLGGSHVSIAPGGAAENMTPGAEFKNTQGAVDLFGLIGRVLRPTEGAAPAAAAPAEAPAAAADPYPG
jgi:phospholipid/cholesterol/gamma-HCH transport system substrate-binding protein